MRQLLRAVVGSVFIGVLHLSLGCGAVHPPLLPNEATGPVDEDRFELVARFAHISDAQIIDEESPARLAIVSDLSTSAWRPHERFSIHLLDGTVRAINKIHVATQEIDFVVHTGDATDNTQLNELRWFMTAMDGGPIDPRSGPDDRNPDDLPDPSLDPHHPFEAQGLYRRGVHGDRPTISWFNVLGNHDRFAVGVFPIVTDLFGNRSSPLALPNRIGLFLPVTLNPVGFLAWGPITPANPGPPVSLQLPVRIEPNPERRYVTTAEFIEAHRQGVGLPVGHGLGSDGAFNGAYSVEVAPGVRLIGINSSSPAFEQPTLIYSEGAISVSQLQELERHLQESQRRGELVIVASHHPALSLEFSIGTAVLERSLVALLNHYPCVVLHICGHLHENLVIDRGGYLEIVTGSILDTPQQGRIVEIYRTRGEPQASARADVRTLMGTRLQGQPPEQSPPPPEQRPIRPGKSDGTAAGRWSRSPSPRGLKPAAREAATRTYSEKNLADGAVEIRYRFFSHLDAIEPTDDDHAALFDDPFLAMRRMAADLAESHRR